MSDQGEGSSSAAQGAQIEDEDRSVGFLGRIFNALSGDEDRGEDGEPGTGRQAGSLANLTDMRTEDVMLPKVEIVAVPSDIEKESLVEIFRESGLTRLPVYSGTLDSPLGLIHLKDFALRHGFNGSDGEFELKSMLRPLLFAPPSMPIGVLLQKMQNDRIHMALVIDEYGGVDGLVTIEDLIEQVLGEIEDEHDEANEGRYWTEEAPGCYLVQARAPLDDFEQEIGRKLVPVDEDEEVETLGGLVFMLAERIPARGEIVKHPDGLNFEVVDADPRRIKRLRVRTSMTKAAE